MKKKGTMLIAAVLSLTLFGCTSAPTPTSSAPQTGDTTSASTELLDMSKVKGTNQDKTLIVEGGIPDPALFIANQHSEAGTGNFGDFAYEGLIKFQRGTDDIEFQLAESVSNEGNKTIFKLRPNIKWNDGVDFTSKDIWAFYIINPNPPSDLLVSVETPDDLTVEFVWQDPAPSDDMRLKLIAQEIHHGRVAYHIYGEYADQMEALYKQMSDLTPEQKAKGIRAPFGKDNFSNPEIATKKEEIYKAYCEKEPNPEHILIGTGPYVNDVGHTINEATMSPNPYYWNKEKQTYDKIVIKATTDATKPSMMQNEEIYWMNGTLPKDLTDSLLKSNESIVYYPMEDAGCHGLFFNTQSKTSPMNKKEFRQALNYIADKEALRDIGSYQSKINPWSMTVIPPSMLETYVGTDVIDKMTKYSKDEAKATQLLESIGCTKVNGKWNNPDGTPIKITIGFDKNWYVASLVIPIYANQLKQFGLDTEVMAVDGSVYGKQADDEHAFDMSFDWYDIAWNFSYPYFPLENNFGAKNGRFKKMNLPYDDQRMIAQVEMQDWDGKNFDLWSTITQMQYQDEETAKESWERIIWATNEEAYGINFYQNVTGSWENISKTAGLPMLDKVPSNRWMPFPETQAEKVSVYNLNVGFSNYIRKTWMISPNY